MDVRVFQEKVAEWRIKAGLSQADLDEKCGFAPNTVGRIERQAVKMTDEQFVSILVVTKRDLVWTLLESVGSLYKSLQPLEEAVFARLGQGFPPRLMWEDEEFQSDLNRLLSGARAVFTKMAKASDAKSWLIDLMVRAADQDSKRDLTARKRVRRRRPATASSKTNRKKSITFKE